MSQVHSQQCQCSPARNVYKLEADKAISSQKPFKLSRRRISQGFMTLIATSVLTQGQSNALPIASSGSVKAQTINEFNKSFTLDDGALASSYWTKAIKQEPENVSLYINRGYAYMQLGRYQEARDDLRYALSLQGSPTGPCKGVLLELGTAEGACGDWYRAVKIFALASQQPDEKCQALSKLSMALFQIGRDDAALEQVRSCLRTNPECMDNLALLASMLWANGQPSTAIAVWNTLQDAQRGLGARLYGPKYVKNQVGRRWPPRVQAALYALMNQSDMGESTGLDGKVYNYTFSKVALG